VACRSDYNSDMAAPHDQIAGLGPRDSLKPFDPNVEIGGTRIGVVEASLFVDSMNQMRTVAFRIWTSLEIERRSDHGQTIVWTQRTIGLPPMIFIRALPCGA
jgi:hypothetical protein